MNLLDRSMRTNEQDVWLACGRHAADTADNGRQRDGKTYHTKHSRRRAARVQYPPAVSAVRVCYGTRRPTCLRILIAS